ncbi:MAG: LysM peptidoglycan-binding domain-containing protein [Anaerolineae bacterium]
MDDDEVEPTRAATIVVAPEEAATRPPDGGADVSPTALPASGNPTYIVRTGDTLLSIADRFGASTAAIMRANGLTDAGVLRVGQTLIVPLGDELPASPAPITVQYVVKPGDTLSQIARAHQTIPSAIVSENPMLASAENLPVGATLRITKGNVAAPQLHVVQRGESLASIARARGVDVRTLAQANALVDPNALTVGQVLVIPY